MNKTQKGTSWTSDFSDGTWTFKMEDGFIPENGEFAIVPIEEYKRLIKQPLVEPSDKELFCEAVKKRVGLADFVLDNGLDFKVCRNKGDGKRWVAAINGVVVLDNYVITESNGRGDTPKEATEDLAVIIKGKTLCLGDYPNGKQYIKVPDYLYSDYR